MPKKPPLIVVLVAFVAASLGACSGSSSSSDGRPPNVLTGREAHGEFDAETERLALPAGARWDMNPTQLVLTDETGRPQFYEKGVGAQTAQFQWYCAWGREVVEASSAADRSAGLAELVKFRRMSVWPALDDVGRSEYQTVERQARLGNLQPLDQVLARDCP